MCCGIVGDSESRVTMGGAQFVANKNVEESCFKNRDFSPEEKPLPQIIPA